MLSAVHAKLRAAGRRLASDDRGASLVEYALLVALIAIACFSALAFFGTGSGNSLTNSTSCIEAAYEGEPPPAGCE
jgi:Flp pilus assembly pilin Flp